MSFHTILSILIGLALICLISILPLLLLPYWFIPLRHFILKKIGTQTTATVISSERCDDREDVCVCGVYSYRDRLHREHRVKFRYCWHWPGTEEWDQVMQSCGPGAENSVYYLSWFPLLREIQWNVDNLEIDKRVLKSSLK